MIEHADHTAGQHPADVTTTVCLTVGHTDLHVDGMECRFLIADAFKNAYATPLVVAVDGMGTWEDEDGGQHVETTDVFMFEVFTSTLPSLTALLQSYATTFGADSFGFVIHDHGYGPAYILSTTDAEEAP